MNEALNNLSLDFVRDLPNNISILLFLGRPEALMVTVEAEISGETFWRTVSIRGSFEADVKEAVSGLLQIKRPS